MFELILLLTSDQVVLCMSDSLEFNYHLFYIGEDCATMGWNYIGNACNPMTYTLQAFSLHEVLSNHLSSPVMSLTSTSGRFSFLIRNLTDMMTLHFKVMARDANGILCSTDRSKEFYNFAGVLQNGNLLPM